MFFAQSNYFRVRRVPDPTDKTLSETITFRQVRGCVCIHTNLAATQIIIARRKLRFSENSKRILLFEHPTGIMIYTTLSVEARPHPSFESTDLSPLQGKPLSISWRGERGRGKRHFFLSSTPPKAGMHDLQNLTITPSSDRGRTPIRHSRGQGTTPVPARVIFPSPIYCSVRL